MNDTIILTRFLSSWYFQILAIIFLNNVILLIVFKEYMMAIALFIVFCVCEFYSFQRQKEVYDEKGTERRTKARKGRSESSVDYA